MRSEEGVRYAERALALANELGLDRPGRALGFRGFARANVGDPGGLEDFREAIALATQAGQGREVALLHNNLGVALWSLEGPTASLEVLRDGVAFAQARGLTEMLETNTTSSLDPLAYGGSFEDALEIAADLAERLDAIGDVWDLVPVRACQVQILTLRGKAAEVIDELEWLESATRVRSLSTCWSWVSGLAR